MMSGASPIGEIGAGFTVGRLRVVLAGVLAGVFAGVGAFAAPAPAAFEALAAVFDAEAAGFAVEPAALAAPALAAFVAPVPAGFAAPLAAVDPAVTGFDAEVRRVPEVGTFSASVSGDPAAEDPATGFAAAARLRGARAAPAAAPAAPSVAPPAAASGAPVLGEAADCGSSGRSPSDGGCGVLMRLPPLP
ncbi:hypothetical protein P5G50_12440 [Leifsonia sp. F6_8S_P_1B]|uniref:Uncharacterized protein n=2 Tax=Leifsonia williamsii TaxID=3035919 RepID=A0ABT8KFI8_9MICO|nr:hypothetical protein [Leifsonia williamsii]MDN4615257.1 hypothetical protein [Leifsonia williamsii]